MHRVKTLKSNVTVFILTKHKVFKQLRGGSCYCSWTVDPLPSPWTGSRDADRSDSASLRIPVLAISHGASCVPPRAPSCCRARRSERTKANRPCKVPAVGAALCSCWSEGQSKVSGVLRKPVNGLFALLQPPHLRSLRRAEMVVRRRPLSRLDSAVAIWYSSFSMEKGLAIRRHLRSWHKTRKNLRWELPLTFKKQLLWQQSFPQTKLRLFFF